MNLTPFQRFSAGGSIATDRELAEMLPVLMDAYRSAYDDVMASLRAVLAEYATLPGNPTYRNVYDWLVRTGRYASLMEQIRTVYTGSMAEADEQVFAMVSLAFSNEYYRTQYADAWKMASPTFTPMPTYAAELAVTGTTAAWEAYATSIETTVYGPATNWAPSSGSLADLLYQRNEEALTAIQREIASGLITGRGIDETAKRISAIIGEATKVKDPQTGVVRTKTTGAMAQSVRIARTESIRALNAGRYASNLMSGSEGLVLSRMWVAVLDDRTRPQSASMDGQTVDMDQPFTYPNGVTGMYPGSSGQPQYDVNERCTVVTVAGGDGPSIRRGRNPLTGENELFEWTTFPEWAKANGLTKNRYGQYMGGF